MSWILAFTLATVSGLNVEIVGVTRQRLDEDLDVSLPRPEVLDLLACEKQTLRVLLKCTPRPGSHRSRCQRCFAGIPCPSQASQDQLVKSRLYRGRLGNLIVSVLWGS